MCEAVFMESRSHSSSECSDDLQELDIESGATSTSLPETTFFKRIM